MYKKWLNFTKYHPYWTVIISVIIGSFIGISIEFIINGDFIGSGLYTTIILTMLLLLSTRWQVRKKGK
ncbi:hypothetical protein LFLEISCH_08754 [Listeria fleischmannii subsp. fleischmannii LU2006-1]|nr:hypothetical protein LFLEISCH_08754 [Listeria fleischmannii subsp. fleischmannii LU2006-1]